MSNIDINPGAVYVSRRPYPTLSSRRFQIIRVLEEQDPIATYHWAQIIGEYDEREGFYEISNDVFSRKKIWNLPEKEWREATPEEVNEILLRLFEVSRDEGLWIP